MATMTHSEPVTVAPYVSCSNLCMRLAKRLFDFAMSARAIADPADRSYQAWWTMRQMAEHFIEDRSLDLPAEERGEFQRALIVAHLVAHPHADHPPADSDCDCETAQTVRSIRQLLSGQPRRRRL